VRLNVGCGDHYADGWTNLDLNPGDTVRPDVVGSLTELPPQISGVTAVYCGHVLEHLPFYSLASALRGLWARCVPGATVALVGPDVDRANLLHERGEITAETLHGAIHGAGRWHGDEHLWACTEQLLLDVARVSGLDARPVPIGSPELDAFPVVSRAPWQCAILGAAPGNPVSS
jgi:hypothetical protein